MLGYSKNKKGEVVLTMTNENYMGLMLALGYACGSAAEKNIGKSFVKLVNEINIGNPEFVPYKTSK